jgi:ribokinase
MSGIGEMDVVPTAANGMGKAPKICVVGSLNVDLTYRVDSLTRPGETVKAKSVATSFGGKGANQAVAAARAGAMTTLFGAVGDDEHGKHYREHLAGCNVDTAPVLTFIGEPTGTAMICVDDAGENSIVVHLGANLKPSAEDAIAALSKAGPFDAALFQLEMPDELVLCAAKFMRSRGVTTFLNPSPWRPGIVGACADFDVVILNELECANLLGNDDPDIASMGEALLSVTCAQVVVVTQGADPTIAFSKSGETLMLAPPAVVPVETVGAGDTFTGAFAAEWLRTGSLRSAVAFANQAAALSTQRHGAQTAIPLEQDVRALMT